MVAAITLAPLSSARAQEPSNPLGASSYNLSYKDMIGSKKAAALPYKFTYRSSETIQSGNIGLRSPDGPDRDVNFSGALGISYDPSRFNFALHADHGKTAYNDNSKSLGHILNRNNVQQNYTDVSVKVGYKLNAAIRPYVQMDAGHHDYEQYDLSSRAFSENKGDSRSAGVMAGLQFAFKGFVQGFFAAGYENRSYRDSRNDDIGNLKLASNLGWNINKKATLNLGLHRFSTEDPGTLSGKVVTEARLNLDYNVLHNLFFNAFINFSYSDYSHYAAQKDYLSAGTGLRYRLDDKMSLSGDYNFVGKDSTLLGLDEDRHEFLLKLHSKF
jgi:hypothetical protein